MFARNVFSPRSGDIFRKLFFIKNGNSVPFCNRHGSIELEQLREQTNVETNDSFFFKINNTIFKSFEFSLNQLNLYVFFSLF